MVGHPVMTMKDCTFTPKLWYSDQPIVKSDGSTEYLIHQQLNIGVCSAFFCSQASVLTLWCNTLQSYPNPTDSGTVVIQGCGPVCVSVELC